MTPGPAGHPHVYLLDIEGTTTPLTFVHDVLFPYAQARLESFLRSSQGSAAVEDLLAEQAAEAGAAEPPGVSAGPRAAGLGEAVPGPPRPPAASHDEAIVRAAHRACSLMARDRKSPALKSLQGQIWQAGYAAGALTGLVFDDVPRALARWRERGARAAIFSSGSTLAQQLLLGHTAHGDLRPLVSAHFDLAVGGKREAASYARIGHRLGLAASAVTFVSDVVAELDAARQAGMGTRLAIRPGNPEPPPHSHACLRSFDELD